MVARLKQKRLWIGYRADYGCRTNIKLYRVQFKNTTP